MDADLRGVQTRRESSIPGDTEGARVTANKAELFLLHRDSHLNSSINAGHAALASESGKKATACQMEKMMAHIADQNSSMKTISGIANRSSSSRFNNAYCCDTSSSIEINPASSALASLRNHRTRSSS